jgi:WD40 repeat protein
MCCLGHRQYHVPLVGHDGEIMSLTFSHDGTRFLFGSDDKTVRVWDFVQANVMSPAHTASVTSVAFSQSDKRMVSLSLLEMCSWDTMSGTCLFITNFQLSEVIFCPRFPSAVLTGSDTRPVSTRDVAENAEEVNDLLPLKIFYKRAGKRKAVKTSSTDVP